MAFALVLQGPIAAGRFLLMLATISVLTAPVTQDVWSWDHFLRGGQDFETGMLTVVVVLCLALLLSQVCKRHIDALLTCVLASASDPDELAGGAGGGTSLIVGSYLETGTAIGSQSLPLKI